MQPSLHPRSSSILEEFQHCHDGYPAKSFDSVEEARTYTRGLTELEISFMVKLVRHPKRLKLPMQTIVLLIPEQLDPRLHH